MVFPSTPRTHPLSADTHERASEYQRKADEMRTRALHALEPDARAAFHQMATGYELWAERLLNSLPSRSRV